MEATGTSRTRGGEVAERQFCTFYVEGLCFGIGVREVQEVIRYQEMTRVPLAASVVRGLINLRGQIVTAIDLRRRLELPDRFSGEAPNPGADAGEALPMNLVVRTDDGVVSLLVDEIGEVVEVDEDSFERPPPTLSGVARELVRGVYKREGSLLLVLDTARAVSVSRP
ncbi:MAG TPA: chemotaxis protein CheW [Acidimicrobiia bacterium]|nr:chemotaxis protein CheW [Acidimicrobiia bacterium]